MKIETALIQATGRIRDADAKKVAAIAESIKEVGLLNPITVFRRDIIRAGQDVAGFGLIAGMHRLNAVQSLGWAEVDAVVLDLNEQQRVIAECDENLCVSELSPSDRALFTAKRKEAYIALHPETALGTNQHSRVRQLGEGSDTARFTAETAAATGKSERVVQRDAGRGENIDPTALAMVRGTHLDKGTFLDMLAKAPEADQVKIVRNHLARKTTATPSKAREKVDVKSDAEVVADEVADMVRRWNKLSPESRAMFLSEIDLPVMDMGAS